MANINYAEKLKRLEAQIACEKELLKTLLRQQRAEERIAGNRRLAGRGKIVESLIDGAETLSDEEIQSILTAALNPPAPEEPAPVSFIGRIFLYFKGTAHDAPKTRDAES